MKVSDADTECPHKLQGILDSPPYVPAIEDVVFLESDKERGVRLQLDFLKPDTLLREHGVQHTKEPLEYPGRFTGPGSGWSTRYKTGEESHGLDR